MAIISNRYRFVKEIVQAVSERVRGWERGGRGAVLWMGPLMRFVGNRLLNEDTQNVNHRMATNWTVG